MRQSVNIQKNQTPNIIAVVVTYNRKDILRKSLDCILRQKNCLCDIMVVDNNSIDGTRDMVKKDFDNPHIIYHNTGTNLGGAGGFQQGIKKAVLAGYKYIWIMDDDTWPEEDALYELINAHKKLNGQWGFLSSVAYWTDGNICEMNIQKRGIFKHIDREYKANISPIKMCSYVSLLIKAEIIMEVGLPIGEYFIWTDDYEYTGRITKKYPCYMVTESRVIHAMKNNARVDFVKDTPNRIERYKYIYRNDVHCYRQYGLRGWIYLILKDLYTCMRLLIYCKDSKWERIRTVWAGFCAGLFFYPSIEMIERQQ